MTDAELLKAIAAGDQTAFRAFVDRHQKAIFGLVMRFVRNREDAEDIAQEIFFKAWAKAGDFRGDSAPATWLYRIAINTSLNFQRKHKHSRQLVSTEQLGDLPGGPADHPEHRVAAADAKRLFYGALEQVPEKYRIPFMLNKLEGISYQEIADILQLSLANVETRIHRAKLALQKILIKYIE